VHQLLKRIEAACPAGLGAVLHVGAGACGELEDFLRLKAHKLLLVEADLEQANVLLRRTRARKSVQVLAAAATPVGGPGAVLRVLNNPRESTLLPPTRLLERFPNLRLEREVPVPAFTLPALVERLMPDSAHQNLLVIEAPGVELALLASLPLAELQRFSWLALRACVEPMHEGGARFEQLDALLRRSEFVPVIGPRPGSALPFQRVLYQLDTRSILASMLDRQAMAAGMKT
jgi:hypothetical protein